LRISVHHEHFSLPEEAFGELEQEGLFPLEMEVPAVKNESHWHDFTTSFYILQGQLKITDASNDRVLFAGPGSRVDVPRGVLHHEESSGYGIIAGMSVDPTTLTGPIDLDPELLEVQ
jgi:hypothetical protein